MREKKMSFWILSRGDDNLQQSQHSADSCVDGEILITLA